MSDYLDPTAEHIAVGAYTLTKLRDGKIWMQHESGEGMSANAVDLEKTLNEFFTENF